MKPFQIRSWRKRFPERAEALKDVVPSDVVMSFPDRMTLDLGGKHIELLYIDDKYNIQPQMCAGHELSADRLTWTFHLRDGLTFHDGEKVLARDCAKSVQRWAVRDTFGQKILAQTEEIATIDDRSFRIRLKKPFSLKIGRAHV